MNFGDIPAGSVLPVFFDSYAGATGASITITGLAITDIEIYKGTSMTQRSSDAGYVLLDTDGIDIDGITGIHGFSIDTGDNTDAGFYTAGSFFNVVVSAITVDGQTVNFVAARFRIVAAENTAGTPVADTVRVGGGSVPSGAIPNAVAGAAGGVLISGANAGTTTFGAMTVTGALTLSGGISTTTIATSGTVTLNALTVTNATTLTGAVSLGSTLDVAGTTTLAAVATGAITATTIATS